jgi:hypothetical protein
VCIRAGVTHSGPDVGDVPLQSQLRAGTRRTRMGFAAVVQSVPSRAKARRQGEKMDMLRGTPRGPVGEDNGDGPHDHKLGRGTKELRTRLIDPRIPVPWLYTCCWGADQ